MAEDRHREVELDADVANALDRLRDLAARHCDVLAEAVRAELAERRRYGATSAPERVGLFLIARLAHAGRPVSKDRRDLVSLTGHDLVLTVHFDEQERPCFLVQPRVVVLLDQLDRRVVHELHRARHDAGR